VWLLFHVGPIKDDKGEVMLFLVTLKDITEYKDPIVGPGNIVEYVRLYHHSFSHIRRLREMRMVNACSTHKRNHLTLYYQRIV